MGIISSIVGISGAKKQKKIAKRQARAAEAQAAAEREKQRIEQVRANLQVRQEKQKQLRQQRLRRAQILATAANSGATGSSSVQGALGSIGTQVGANLGQINVQQGFSEAISEQNEASAFQASEINRLQGKANVQAAKTQVFQSIGNLGQSVFDRAGGFTTVFGGNNFGGG